MSLMKEIDARTKLAGANKLELLLFSLGTEETYGINVFKIREVLRMPPMVIMPEVDNRIEGMANLRGAMVPVIGLRPSIGLEKQPPESGYLIVSEHNNSSHGLHVSGVDRIIRISWDQVKPPPTLLGSKKSGVTAVTILEDGRSVLILDVEKILAEIWPEPTEAIETLPEDTTQPSLKGIRVIFADDSVVARKQIQRTLERLGITSKYATTGREAYIMLQDLADQTGKNGKRVTDELDLILTDVEMPEMDGFTLVKKLREDPRFLNIPILLHSSLMGTCNVEKGKMVGATDYLTKFDPVNLRQLVTKYCVSKTH